MRRNRLSAVALAVLCGSAALAQDHPETLGKFHPGYGHEWTAASFALNRDGSVHERVQPGLRENIEYQTERSVTDHGLAEGAVPARRPHPASGHQFCAPVRTMLEPLPQETDRFDATMLLSEVAAVATVSDIVPGFRLSGDPQLLVVLSDVQVLRNGSPLPRYVLIPLTGRVIHGKVFCAVNPPGWTISIEGSAIVGDRIVVMGAWRDDAVVEVGLNRTGAVAFVKADETLDWNFAGRHDGPSNLLELDERFNEARSAGLFDLTHELLSEPWGSARRTKLGTTLGELSGHFSECHVQGFEIDDGDLRFVPSCPNERPVP